jgi:hypothetical protein
MPENEKEYTRKLSSKCASFNKKIKEHYTLPMVYEFMKAFMWRDKS